MTDKLIIITCLMSIGTGMLMVAGLIILNQIKKDLSYNANKAAKEVAIVKETLRDTTEVLAKESTLKELNEKTGPVV